MPVQYGPGTAPPDEISMWPIELQSASLPPICVKTGRPAWRYYTVRIVASVSGATTVLGFMAGPYLMPGAVRARLPFARRPLIVLAGLSVARVVTSVLGLACIMVAIYVPDAPRTLLLVIGVLSAASATWIHVAYFLKSQIGEIHRTPYGQSWVRLRRVHPNFVAAIDAWRQVREAALRDPAAYSVDLRWHWNGMQWVSTLPVVATSP